MKQTNRLSITSSSFRRKLNEHKSKQHSFCTLPLDPQATVVSSPFSSFSASQQQQQQTIISDDSSVLPLSSALPCSLSGPSVIRMEDNNLSLPQELNKKSDLAQLKMFVLQTMPLRDFLTSEWQKIYDEYQKLCKPYWMNQKPRVRNPLVELRTSLRSFDEVTHMDVSSSSSSSSGSSSSSSSCLLSPSKVGPTYESPFTPDNQEQNFKNQMTGNNGVFSIHIGSIFDDSFFLCSGWEFCLCNPKIASFIIIHKCVFFVCFFFLLKLISVTIFIFQFRKAQY